MTITRIGQLTAEARVVSNVTLWEVLVPPTISSTKVHTGSFAYKLGSSPVHFGIADAVTHTAYRLGYWLNHLGFQNNSNFAVLYTAATSNILYESPAIHIQVNVAANTLSVIRPATGTFNAMEVLSTVAFPASLATTNSWIHVGITHKIAEVDGFLSLYVNGVRALNYVGDTRLFGQNSGTNIYSSSANTIYGAGNLNAGAIGWDNTIYIDDMYLDSYESEADALVPARTFDVQLTPVAGANAEWTPSAGSNFQNVDENPNTGDTDYNKATATGKKDTFNFSNITVPSDHRIIAMIPVVFVKNLDVGPLIRLHAYDGSTYENSDDLTPALDYNIPVFARFEVDPSGVGWTETTANAAQFGMESRGSFA